MDHPTNRTIVFKSLQPFVCQELLTLQRIGCRAEALTKCCVPLGDHLLSAFFPGIPGSVADDHLSSWLETAQGFVQCCFIVFRIVKRRIEDDHIKLLIPEWEVRCFGLESRDRCRQ